LNTHNQKNFIPALRYHAFTRFYDTVVRFTTRETVFKTALVKQSVSHPGERLLDLGCGTGTLTMMMAENEAALQVVGVDTDPTTLEKLKKSCLLLVTASRYNRALRNSCHSKETHL